ncbi:BTB/POZ domain-containing protein [Rhynchospora pubera]|uniref:BTB/POZ domain-containing protein n=1 Tax=Rhynchospora pubera TaxID=906938 RepID=A0AAV8EKI2_9POAL|nr:BTB/POZ domain-containing protein [Rhynchospora pubera]
MGLHSTSPRFGNSRRIFSDVAGDITIYVDGQPFLLHKFPLMTRCGRIRRLISESRDPDLSKLELQNVPGGTVSFELAAKFCYGSNFEITPANVSHLHCIAHYLDMSEDYQEENLISRTETYLNEIIFKSLEKSLQVLCGCEGLDPLAEDIGLVGRCIESIAFNASTEQLVSGLAHLEYHSESNRSRTCYRDWWVEDLSVLKVEYYKRVIGSMRRAGVRTDSIINSIMHYAQTSLKPIESQECNMWEMGSLVSDRQRSIVVTLVELLSLEKLSSVPLSFLFGMLRMAIEVDAVFETRIELEKRIGLQLDMASLDDLLIPSTQSSDSVYDVDTVHRILVNFLQKIEEDGPGDDSGYESDGTSGPVNHAAVLKVGRLMDGYLAEIAPDPYLKLQKFMTFIELLPDYARVVDDGLYRAIDIYLKAHPSLTESECTKLCKLIDCEKLSIDAANHASQNERLPVQISVRILYFEQLRLKSALLSNSTSYSHRIIPTSGAPSAPVSPRDNYASLRRENRELRLEIGRMRVRITELEKEQEVIKRGMRGESAKAFFGYISKGLVRMTSFGPGVGRKKEKNDGRKVQGRNEGRNRRRNRSAEKSTF